MEWITSDGGPLICLGHSAIDSWKGIDGLGEPRLVAEGYRNDYERACGIRDYLGLIPVSGSFGIVLGEAPLDTTIMTSSNGAPLIVRVFYSEPEADIRGLVDFATVPEKINEVESVTTVVTDSYWYVFDSAYPGYLGLKRCLSFRLPIGRVCIKTFEYKPNSETFLLLHRFLWAQ